MSVELAPPFFFGSGFSVVDLSERNDVLAKALETQRLSSSALDTSVRSWLSYLESLKYPHGEMSPAHVDAVLSLWKVLSREIGMTMRPPLTQVAGDDAIQLAWEAGQLYFDLDVFPDGSLAWFFRDRESGAASGSEEERLTYIPGDAMRLLKSVLGQ